MKPAEQAQRRRIESLDAERQAVDTGRGKGAETGDLRRVRVGLEGHFEIACHDPALPYSVEQDGNSLGRHQGRRTAPEEDRADLAPLQECRMVVEVGQ